MSGRHRRPDQWDQPPRVEPAPASWGLPRAAPPSVVPRRSRTAEREQRRRAARRRTLRLVALGVVGLLVLGAGGWWWLLRGEKASTPGPAPQAGRQHTLLLQVTGADGVAAANALIGVTPRTAKGAIVLIPSGLLVDLPSTGTVPFGETTTLGEPTAGSDALTDLLGVRIDAHWVLHAEGLSGLVDTVGGVRVTVDTDVVSTDPQGGTTVLVRAGAQELSGRDAVAYATFLGEGEPEQERLARFDDVLTAVLAALPQDSRTLVSAVTGLGTRSQSTLSTTALAQRLGDLRAAAVKESLVSDVLPVNQIDSGGGVPTYGINTGQVGDLLRAWFPGSLQSAPGGGVVRVLVENGVGTPGLVEEARAKLVAAGFRFVNGGNAAEFTQDPSSVIIPDGTEESLLRGQEVAAALGLPESAIATSDRGQSVADVIVILGTDFAP